MTVQLVLDGAVAEVVLNRPDKLNALDDEMLGTLGTRLDEAEAAGARAIVLRGEGRGFSAGRDLGAMDAEHEDSAAWLAEHVSPLVLRIADLPLPTFAAVHGPCLGIGLGLALACDVVVAAEDARIGSPFASIGAVLDSGGHWFFVERLGPQRALDLIYTARLMSGTEAAASGLVTRAIPGDDLLGSVRETARAVAAGPTRAFALSKAIVRRIGEERLNLGQVLALEAHAQGAASATADYQEGMAAFKEKRAPTFGGR
ncbi:MAG: enoyl-CoA hydratase/isomerase family protein [Acidimicrobiia bacterium]|nr:enoyl-CoA hydratase/isomerase family protein [Acidimicrobiia bacterium]